MAIPQLVYILGFPLIRAILGWIENAFEDNYISKLEWKELVTTVIRIGTPVLIVALGVTQIGADEAIITFTAIAATLIDILWNKFKHKDD